ncbi:MAG: ester cyclase [Blastocatellales bacterium]
MSEANKYQSVVNRVIEEFWNQGKLAVADELFAADYVRHDPATSDIAGGVDGARAVCARFRTGFPNLSLTVADLLADGDKAIVRWSASGTHQGELMGIAPTGKKFDVTGITIFRFADSKVAEEWVNWDTLGMMQQLGGIQQ